MARRLYVNRDEADVLVDLLEHEYRAGRVPGFMADFAAEIRAALGMTAQPDMSFGEKQNEPPLDLSGKEREDDGPPE